MPHQRAHGAPDAVAAPGNLRVPFHPSSARVARSQLREWLRHGECGPHDLGDLAERGELVVSELVGNAVRHARPVAGGLVGVAWSLCPEGLTISVTDGGSATRPQRVDAATGSQSGRGLAIIESVATRWWTETSPTGVTVHVLVDHC